MTTARAVPTTREEVALFLGVAFAVQLEAVRAGVPEPRVERDENRDAAAPARARV